MSANHASERRQSARVELVTFCPVTFVHGEREFEALMADVSERGACMMINGHHDNPELDIDEEISYAIRTPYGESRCAGTTVWVTDHDEGLSWGVCFTSFPESPDDPLRNLLDSPF